MSDILKEIIDRLDQLEKLVEKKDKPFLTFKELVNYTGLPANTLYAYSSQNKIPGKHVLNGKRLFFEKKAIDDWILRDCNKQRSVFEIEQEASDLVLKRRLGA